MITHHKVTGHKVGTIDTEDHIKIRNNKELRWYDDGNYVGFEAPALSADQIWTLPNADGTSGQVLRTDGSGVLSWATAAAGAGQVELDDTDADQVLIFDWSEDGAADYTLDWKVNASNRTINLSGNLTVEATSTLNQDLTTDATLVQFASLGIGTATVPHGTVGMAKFAIEGTNQSTAGPHMQFTTASDDYPLMQFNNWQHDSVSIHFDSYYDGTNHKSSDAGSNYRIHKGTDQLHFEVDSGVAQGANLTWVIAGYVDTSSNWQFNGNVTSTGTGEFQGASVTVGDADTAGTLILSDGSSHTITIDVPSIAGSWTLTLPTTDGDNTQVMITDGSGNLSWTGHDGLADFASNEHYTQASITTVGTIGTGTWSATDIANTAGGTGQDSSGWTGYAYVSGGTWAQGVITNITNGIRIAGASSDYIDITHDGTDATFATSDGIFIFDSAETGGASLLLSDGSANYITVDVPSISSDYTMTLPTAVASAADEVMVSGGADAALSFKDINKIVYKTIILKCVDDLTAPTVTDTAGHVTIPIELNGYDLVSVGAHVYTASDGSGPVALHILNLTDSHNILSTGITIDDNEIDSKDAGTPAVIDTGEDDVVTGDVLQIHVTDIGSATTRGLEVRMGFRLP